MFSLAWYYVNRGSKYWQENWELHVSFLEEEVCGPISGIIKKPNDHFWTLHKGYPFSVSRINQLLSLFILIFWLFTFIYSLFFTFGYSFSDSIPNIFYFFLIVCVLGLSIGLITIFSISSHRKNSYDGKQKEGIFIKSN